MFKPREALLCVFLKKNEIENKQRKKNNLLHVRMPWLDGPERPVRSTTALPCSPGGPRIHFVDKAGLDLMQFSFLNILSAGIYKIAMSPRSSY